MPGHKNSPIDNHSALSSPLSSLPSTYVSLPSPASSGSRYFSAPMPVSKESPILVERGIGEPPRKMLVDGKSVRDVISKSEPSRGTYDMSFNSLGLSFENRKLSFRSRKGKGETKRLENLPTDERDSLSAVATPHRRPLLAFFSSLSTNLNPWPSSPLANKIDKSLGKRKAALLDENGNAMSGGIAQQKKVDRKASPKGYLVEHNSSPDYKMLLNLSDTPSQADASGDPFTQSHQVPERNASAYYITTSRDASLSPTIKNPSLGSLDSEEISAVCLAPPRERRSPSYGLFACSRILGDGQSDDATESAKPNDMEEIESRRIAEVMERWAKTGISISDTTSIELYKSPPTEDRVRRRPMIALAPPRPVDRLSLEQQSRALDHRPQYAPVSGLADSNGLLDAVCEAEAMLLQRSIGPGWAFSSLAPADMHLRPTSKSALSNESQRHVPKPNVHQPVSVEAKQGFAGPIEAECDNSRRNAESPGPSQL